MKNIFSFPDTAKYLFQVNLPIILLCIAAPFLIEFTILTFIFGVISYFLIYIIANNIYHCYWSHKQFSANPLFLKITAVLGLLVMVGDPISYAKSHRHHHRYSDSEKDIHSPMHGIFHSLIGWMFKDHKLPLIIVRDIVSNPENKYLVKLAQHQVKIIWFILIICCIINLHLFVGLIYAMVLGFSIEMLTNAFSHSKTTKTSIDNYWISVIGLHQQHREHHINANSGNKNTGKYLFLCMEKLKLISR